MGKGETTEKTPTVAKLDPSTAGVEKMYKIYEKLSAAEDKTTVS